MFILMPVIFVLGILAIALEDKIKINKAAIALFMAISMWMILMFDAYNIFVQYDLSRVLDPEPGDGQLAPA